jgi:hypothetical protein
MGFMLNMCLFLLIWERINQDENSKLEVIAEEDTQKVTGSICYYKKDILASLHQGNCVFEVELLEDSKVCECSSGKIKRWKTDKYILKNKRRINLETIKKLVEQGANIHVGGELPLYWAVEKGHLDIVKYIIDKGADMHKHKNSLMCWAASRGNLDLVKYFIEQGADIYTKKTINSPLYWATKNNELEVVNYLNKLIEKKEVKGKGEN